MVDEHFEPEGFDFKNFPPVNHENLHRPSQPNHQNPEPLSPSPSSPSLSTSSSSSPSSFSPSDSDESGPISPLPSSTQVRKPGEVVTWLGIGLEVLRSKASSFGFDKVWCFASGAGMAAVGFLFWSLYLRARRRRYPSRLKLIVKEKDEKINKLLHQIAQLNEVLVARHRALASKLAN